MSSEIKVDEYLATETGVCDAWKAQIGEILFTKQQIQQRVAELGKEISDHYKAQNLQTEILVVGLLKGSILFFADLVRHIDVPYKIDFMAVSSYGSGTSSSGTIKVKKDLDVDPTGRHILVVEDLIDTGNTLAWLTNMLATKSPASVKLCTLLDKKERRTCEMNIDFNGFDCPDKFVVGYGMDFDENFRCIPFVGVLKPEAYAHLG